MQTTHTGADFLEATVLFPRDDETQPGYHDTNPDTVDAAQALWVRFGPGEIRAFPFDGGIVLARHWAGDPADPHGREVELHADETMSLVGDPSCGGDVDQGTYRVAIDLDQAGAWLGADTRRIRGNNVSDAPEGDDPLCRHETAQAYRLGYLEALRAALGVLDELQGKPDATLEHAAEAVARLGAHVR